MFLVFSCVKCVRFFRALSAHEPTVVYTATAYCILYSVYYKIHITNVHCAVYIYNVYFIMYSE